MTVRRVAMAILMAALASSAFANAETKRNSGFGALAPNNTTLYMTPMGQYGEEGTAVFNSRGQLLNNNVAAIQIRQALNDHNKTLTINIGQPASAPVIGRDGIVTIPVSPSLAGTFWVGCYMVRISWERHYVGDCIRKDVWHLGMALKYTCNPGARDICDWHACAWWEGRSPQFGLYQSFGRKFCAQSRGTWTEIRDRFYLSCAAAGLSYWAAVAISNAAASVTVAAFAL